MQLNKLLVFKIKKHLTRKRGKLKLCKNEDVNKNDKIDELRLVVFGYRYLLSMDEIFLQ